MFFVHTDHLGSTMMLSCFKEYTCPDGTPWQYFRYDAYGVMKAFNTSGAAVGAGYEATDLLYTGQRWGWTERLYDYGARVYDPRIARFLTEDPVREYMNPYAYVAWNPVKYVDAEGRVIILAPVFLIALGGASGALASYYTGGSLGTGFAVGASAAAVGVLSAGLGVVGASVVGSSAGGALGTATSIAGQSGLSGLMTVQAAGAILVNATLSAGVGLAAGVLAETAPATLGVSLFQADVLGSSAAGLGDLVLSPTTNAVSNFGAHGFSNFSISFGPVGSSFGGGLEGPSALGGLLGLAGSGFRGGVGGRGGTLGGFGGSGGGSGTGGGTGSTGPGDLTGGDGPGCFEGTVDNPFGDSLPEEFSATYSFSMVFTLSNF